MEVYAGFSEYTDEQVGRIVDYLEKTGQIENTLIIYAADNGASGEGSPYGSVNENKCAKLYFDQAFNEALYKQKLGYSAFAVTSRSESDTQIVCNYTGKKLGSLPGPVSKVMGDSSYKEDVTFDKSSRLGRSKFTLSVLSDKVRLDGDLRIVPVGDNQANRVLTYSIEAKVFGVGGLLESTFEKMLREEADVSAALMNQWIAEGKV